MAYELVPESKVAGGGRWIVFAFALGALVFFFADWAIDRSGGVERKSIEGGRAGDRARRSSSALLDGVPESLILGMGLATGGAISVGVSDVVSWLLEIVAGTRSPGYRAVVLAAGRSPRATVTAAVCTASSSRRESLGFAGLR